MSPASGSGSRTLTTGVNTAGLTAGTYNGTLTVSAAGISSKTVSVTLTVNAPATSSTTLTWNANTENDLAGYKIYRATTSGGYGALIATVPGNVTTYIAAGLQVGKTYFFVITAYDSAVNESVRSKEVSKSITQGEKTIHRLSHTKEGLFMEIAKIVLVSFRTVVKQGPLGILSLIVAVAGLLIFHVAGTAGTGLLEDHKIIFLAAIVGLTIVFVVTLLLIMVWDRRKR